MERQFSQDELVRFTLLDSRVRKAVAASLRGTLWREQVEDVTQGALLAVHARWHAPGNRYDVKSDDELVALTVRIARNLAVGVDRRREIEARLHRSLDPEVGRSGCQYTQVDQLPYEDRQWLEPLSKAQRAIVMAKAEGLSLTEAAERRGVSKSTAQVHLTRARTYLRRSLAA